MKELFESNKFKMESLTYLSPAQKILKEHLQNLDKLKDLYSPHHKLMENLNIAIPNLNNTIAELSTKNEKIYQSIGLINPEFEKVINNLINNNIVLETSLWSKVSSIIKDSKIDYLKNLNESRFKLIQDNFKDSELDSELATITFIETISAEKLEFNDDEIDNLSKNVSVKLNEFILNPQILSWFYVLYFSLHLSPDQNIETVVKSLVLQCVIGLVINYQYDKSKEELQFEKHPVYHIEPESIHLKSKPKKTSKTLQLLNRDNEIIIIKSNYKWIYITTKDENNKSLHGWIKKEFIDFPEK